jgi:general L-amino acid transport system permease protein
MALLKSRGFFASFFALSYVERMETERRVWQHPKFWSWAIQGLVLLLIGLAVLFCGTNLATNLAQKHLRFGFEFLRSQAGFNISETLVSYRPTDNYFQALRVGLVNSLCIMALSLVLANLLGVGIGIARLSSNWLLRQFAGVYGEVLRNTPLLLQLMFWYFAVFKSSPPFEQRLSVLGDLSFSQRGLLLPNFSVRLSLMTWLICLGIGVTLARWVWRIQHRRRFEAGEPIHPWFMAGVTLLFWLSVAWVLTKETPFSFAWPSVQNNTIQAGLLLTPEYSALLLGLTLYTAAFIAEIVRGGIMAVPKGQWEASRSLGFSSSLTLRLIVIPQALRLMVPLLTTQYLNLAKNSSLAIAIGYPDLYAIASTTFDRTDRAIEVTLLLIATYLAISLIISIAINLYSRQIHNY